jgi:hypothetical protein
MKHSSMDCGSRLLLESNYQRRLQTSQTTIKKIFTRQEGNNQKGDYKINGSRIYKRNSSSRLASDPVLVQKRTRQNGTCASTTRISTNIAQRIHSGYHELIKLSIQQQAPPYYLFLIVTQGIIRSH